MDGWEAFIPAIAFKSAGSSYFGRSKSTGIAVVEIFAACQPTKNRRRICCLPGRADHALLGMSGEAELAGSHELAIGSRQGRI